SSRSRPPEYAPTGTRAPSRRRRITGSRCRAARARPSAGRRPPECRFPALAPPASFALHRLVAEKNAREMLFPLLILVERGRRVDDLVPELVERAVDQPAGGNPVRSLDDLLPL